MDLAGTRESKRMGKVATWGENLNSQEPLPTGHLTVTRETLSWVLSRTE